MRESVLKGRVVVLRWKFSATAAGERSPTMWLVERGMEEKVEEWEEEEDKNNFDMVDLRSKDMVIDYQLREKNNRAKCGDANEFNYLRLHATSDGGSVKILLVFFRKQFTIFKTSSVWFELFHYGSV